MTHVEIAGRNANGKEEFAEEEGGICSSSPSEKLMVGRPAGVVLGDGPIVENLVFPAAQPNSREDHVVPVHQNNQTSSEGGANRTPLRERSPSAKPPLLPETTPAPQLPEMNLSRRRRRNCAETQKTVAKLTRQLRTETNPRVQNELVKALGKLAETDELCRRVVQKDAQVLARLMSLLDVVGNNPSVGISPEEFSCDPAVDVSPDGSTTLLTKTQSSSSPVCTNTNIVPAESVLAALARIYRQTGQPQIVQRLSSLVESSDVRVSDDLRVLSLIALAHIVELENTNFTAALASLLQEHKSRARVRAQAVRIMAPLAQKDEGARQWVVERLMLVLDDEDEDPLVLTTALEVFLTTGMGDAGMAESGIYLFGTILIVLGCFVVVYD